MSLPERLDFMDRVFPSPLRELTECLRQMREQADELAGERQRLAELFQSAPAAYVVTDALGNIADANQAAVALLGVTSEFLARKPLAAFIAVERRREFRRRLCSIAAREEYSLRWRSVLRRRKGAEQDVELQVRAAGGACRWLLRPV